MTEGHIGTSAQRSTSYIGCIRYSLRSSGFPDYLYIVEKRDRETVQFGMVEVVCLVFSVEI